MLSLSVAHVVVVFRLPLPLQWTGGGSGGVPEWYLVLVVWRLITCTGATWNQRSGRHTAIVVVVVHNMKTAATTRGHNMACQPGSRIFAAFRFFFPTNFSIFLHFFGGSWLMQIRYYSDPIAGLNKCWMVLLKNLYLPVTQCFEKNNIINTQQISNIVLARYSFPPISLVSCFGIGFGWWRCDLACLPARPPACLPGLKITSWCCACLGRLVARYIDAYQRKQTQLQPLQLLAGLMARWAILFVAQSCSLQN